MLTTRSWIPTAALFLSLTIAGCSTSSPPEPDGAQPSVLKAYGLTASAADNSATLSWPGISGATAYNVYWSTRADVSPANATKIANVTSPYSHSGLSNGTVYHYLYTAVTPAGESSPSNAVKVTPKLPSQGAPAKVSALAGDGRATLVWDAVPDATSYSVYWNTRGDVGTQDTRVENITYPAVHTGLTNGQQYYYIVTASTSTYGEVASTEVSTAPHIATPNPPNSVSVSAGDGQVNLSWTPVSDTSGYAIYWNSSGNISLADARIDITTPSYTHSGLTNGTRYFYRIVALNTQGPSILSAQVTARPHVPAPGAPRKVAATAGNEQITLKWDSIPGASQYNLYWDTGAAVTVIANIQPPYVHTPLTGGVAVNYAVTALREGVESASSAQISATPLGPLPPAPAPFPPQAAKKQITLSWNAVDAALGYRLYWHTPDNLTDALITLVNTSTSYSHSNLLDNTTYIYRIEAYTAEGTSPRSEEITATTLPATVPTSTGPPAPMVDSVPDAFIFTAQTNVALGTQVTSSPITVAGIDTAAPISITGGQYSINDGEFTSNAGTVTNGQAVRVRVMSSTQFMTTATTTLTVGGVAAGFSVTTLAADTTPDAFSFTAQTNIALSTQVTSNTISVNGLNTSAPISISGGGYAINAGAFTTVAGTVSNGQTVQVRVTSAATLSTAVNATLTIGGVSGAFSVSTLGADTIPNIFAFTAQTNIALSTQVSSNTITVTGINTAAPISMTGGEYSINGAAFTTAAGTITNNQTVQVRQTSSAVPATTSTATLTIGGVNGGFNVTTVAADTVPNAFSFTAQTDLALSTQVSSNTITVTGINTAAPISISGGEYAINAGVFTTAAGTVSNGQTVQVRVTSAATLSTAVNATLTIGGVSGAFSVSTLGADTIPNIFAFTAQTNIALSTQVSSNTITVTGINTAAPISMTGGEYSINGAAFTAAAGTVTNNQTVQVRQTSSAVPATTSTATLTIGGVSGGFNVTTVAVDTIPNAFSFTAQTNVALSTQVSSNTITVTGINTAAPISITGGEYLIGGATFTTLAGTVINSRAVTVRLTASALPGTTVTAVLTIGGVSGSFSVTTLPTYTVTASAGAGGTITPASVSVLQGAGTNFTATPNTGFSIASVTGCGGTLAGSTYTTGPITANCAVAASFTANSFTVTASAGAGGTITPASAGVLQGESTSFTATPNSGFSIASVTGCGGTLVGNTYTTGLITANCAVAASFVANRYTIGGSIADVVGSGLILALNAGGITQTLAISQGAANFMFVSPIPSGTSYTLSVATQPSGPSQSCSISGGVGTVTNANIASVFINCQVNWKLVNPVPSGYLLSNVVANGNVFLATSGFNGGNGIVTGTINNGSIAWSVSTFQAPCCAYVTKVIWANNQWVAIGSAGAIFTSLDGINWLARQSTVTNDLYNIIWTGSQLVAVGAGGTILTSVNGSTWVSRTSGTANSLHDVVWTGSQLVAVGSVGTILSSADGVVWAAQSIGAADELSKIIWTGQRLVVGSYNGSSLRSSADGISWSAPAPNIGPVANIIWNGNQVLAVGLSSFLTSSDGITWTLRNTNTSLTPATTSSIAWNGSQYVVVGNGIATSPDGVVWTAQYKFTQLHGITWTGTQFIVVGSYGIILTSPDGVTWTSVAPTNSSINGMARTANLWVAAGAEIITSPDGITWTVRNSGVPTEILTSIVWTGSQLVASGSAGSIITSSDGITWTVRASGAGIPFNSIVWTGSQLVGVGARGVIMTSIDGAQWTARASGTTQPLKRVVWTGSQLVAVGSAGTIQTSSDGVTWTARTSGTTSDIADIAWSGTQLMTVTGGNALRSTDGVFWVQTLNVYADSVAWGGYQWLGMGVFGSVRTSTDGLTWSLANNRNWDVSNVQNGGITFLYQIVRFGAAYAAFGYGGFIYIAQ